MIWGVKYTMTKNTDSPASERTSLSLVFQLLTERRRRYVLYYLQAHRRPVPLVELIEHLIAQESDEGQATSHDKKHEQLLTELHNTHIPLLVDAGVVKYDSGTDLLALAENVRPLDEYLRLAEQHDSKLRKT